MKKVTLEDVSEAESKVEYLRNNYLRYTGWEHTSSTPGCYWLWKKKLPNGDVCLMDARMACAIQEHLDPSVLEFEEGDEE